LLAISGDATVKVRFCAAMEEFSLVTDRRIKQAMGRKIVTMFVSNGSKFQCTGVPQEMQTCTRWGNFEALHRLRSEFELELLNMDQVKQVMKRVNG
jgi:hypothetical protein